MQGNVVTAAKWIGGSMVLSCLISVFAMRLPLPPSASFAVRPIASKPYTPSGTGSVRQKSDTDLPSVGCVDRIPILDPSPGHDETTCLDPPSESEAWDLLMQARKAPASFFEVQRNNVRFVIETIGQEIDPVKVYPLAGRCRLVHCHFKVMVSFNETYWSDYPIPFQKTEHCVEAIFINKDHLTRAGIALEEPISRALESR